MSDGYNSMASSTLLQTEPTTPGTGSPSKSDDEDDDEEDETSEEDDESHKGSQK